MHELVEGQVGASPGRGRRQRRSGTAQLRGAQRTRQPPGTPSGGARRGPGGPGRRVPGALGGDAGHVACRSQGGRRIRAARPRVSARSSPHHDRGQRPPASSSPRKSWCSLAARRPHIWCIDRDARDIEHYPAMTSAAPPSRRRSPIASTPPAPPASPRASGSATRACAFPGEHVAGAWLERFGARAGLDGDLVRHLGAPALPAAALRRPRRAGRAPGGAGPGAARRGHRARTGEPRPGDSVELAASVRERCARRGARPSRAVRRRSALS